jgi:hypothetical protein
VIYTLNTDTGEKIIVAPATDQTERIIKLEKQNEELINYIQNLQIVVQDMQNQLL